MPFDGTSIPGGVIHKNAVVDNTVSTELQIYCSAVAAGSIVGEAASGNVGIVVMGPEDCSALIRCEIVHKAAIGNDAISTIFP